MDILTNECPKFLTQKTINNSRGEFMFRKFSICLIVLLSILLTGCLKQFYSLKFNADLSGTYAIRTKIDLAQMSGFAYSYMEKMNKKSLQGVNQEQFKKIFLLRSQQAKLGQEKENITKSLPEGVKLVEMKNRIQGETMIIDMKFEFDNVEALVKMNDLDISAVELAKKYSAQMGGGAGRMPAGGMGGNKGLEFKLDVDAKGDYLIIQQQKSEGQAYPRDQLRMVEGVIPGISQALEESFAQLSLTLPKGYKSIKSNAQKVKKVKHYWKKSYLPKEGAKNERVYAKLKKK